MKNKLKFRVFDKLRKEYIYPDSPGQQHYILTLNGEFYNLQNGSGGDEYVVEQFYNNQDETGKDVYQGDIIENVNGRYALIGNEFELVQKFYFRDDHVIYGASFFGKIIGNINENPGLIKK